MGEDEFETSSISVQQSAGLVGEAGLRAPAAGLHAGAAWGLPYEPGSP